MNKGELIDRIAAETKLTKTQSQKALESFIGAVQDSLKKGKKVTLVGFGTFGVKNRKARKGRNPQTQQVIKIKAKKVPHFSPSSSLKTMVDKTKK
ncbi:HU family DNA-binding protein [candidate division WOR-3 bacterium]|nr:HU family DNA-binding protein [candidate division WOR-3 bacterium]